MWEVALSISVTAEVWVKSIRKSNDAGGEQSDGRPPQGIPGGEQPEGRSLQGTPGGEQPDGRSLQGIPGGEQPDSILIRD